MAIDTRTITRRCSNCERDVPDEQFNPDIGACEDCEGAVLLAIANALLGDDSLALNSDPLDVDDRTTFADGDSGRLRCSSCGMDLGSADDIYRDPTCPRCSVYGEE